MGSPLEPQDLSMGPGVIGTDHAPAVAVNFTDG
jgi:hypothetical protein